MNPNEKKLPGIIITKQNRDEPFTINGNIYNGIKDLALKRQIKTNPDDYRLLIYQDKFDAYIILHSKLYPCFDEFDRMYENRYYRRYMICSSMEEVNEKYKFIVGDGNLFSNCNFQSPQLAPLIYLADDQPGIEIMTVTKS